MPYLSVVNPYNKRNNFIKSLDILLVQTTEHHHIVQPILNAWKTIQSTLWSNFQERIMINTRGKRNERNISTNMYL